MPELQTDSFLTVEGFKRTELKRKASRFIASILPVMNKLEAREFIGKITSEFWDATHHCFAYRLGTGDGIRFRYSDAGEPSGTAGSAIFSAIQGSDITNVALVVTRYFGGTKLGTGPLRRAYHDSALSVIKMSRIETRYLTRRFSFQVPYTELKEVKRMLKSLDAVVFSEEYLGEARFIVDVRKSLVRNFEDRFRGIMRGNAPEILNEK